MKEGAIISYSLDELLAMSPARRGSNWAAFDALDDAAIDTSDIPPIDDAHWSRAEMVLPEPIEDVSLPLQKSVADWIRKADKDRINALLKLEMLKEQQPTKPTP